MCISIVLYLSVVFHVQQTSPRKNSKGNAAAPAVNSIGNGSPVTKVPTTPKTINTSSSGNGNNRGAWCSPFLGSLRKCGIRLYEGFYSAI